MKTIAKLLEKGFLLFKVIANHYLIIMKDLNGANLLRFNKNQLYCLYDIESCSLNTALVSNRCWQIAFLIFTINEIIESYNFFPYWNDIQQNMSKDAARITRFNYDEYKKKSCNPNDALKVFEKFLYNPKYIICGHNINSFDNLMHNLYRKSLGLKTDFSYWSRTIDTNIIAKAIKLGIQIPQDKEERTNMMFKLSSFYQRGMKTSLSALAKENNLTLANSDNSYHDAMFDIKINRELLLKQIWQIEL